MTDVHYDLGLPDVQSKPEYHGSEDDVVLGHPSYNHRPGRPTNLTATQVSEESLLNPADLHIPSMSAGLHDTDLEKDTPNNRNASVATGLKQPDYPSSGMSKISYGQNAAKNRANGNAVPRRKAVLDLETLASRGSLAFRTTHSGWVTPITDDAANSEIAGPCKEEIAESLFVGLCKDLKESWGIADDKAEEASELCVKVFAALYPVDFGALQLPRLREDK